MIPYDPHAIPEVGFPHNEPAMEDGDFSPLFQGGNNGGAPLLAINDEVASLSGSENNLVFEEPSSEQDAGILGHQERGALPSLQQQREQLLALQRQVKGGAGGAAGASSSGAPVAIRDGGSRGGRSSANPFAAASSSERPPRLYTSVYAVTK